MFKFLSRNTYPKPVFSQNHPWLWFSLKFIGTHSKEKSFTISYLIDICGFPPHRAESLSKRMNFKTREKPDTVIQFLNNLGFSQTNTLKIIRSVPEMLRTDPNKILQQKIDFLKSKGFSDSDIRCIITGYPSILRAGLKGEIIPCFDFFNNMFESQHKFMKTVVRYSGILCNLAKCSALNIQYLKDEGVPESIIIRFVEYFPRTLKVPSNRFKGLLQEVQDLGFNPLRLQFVIAVHIKVCLSRSTWARKEGVYRKWGWSDDDIAVAFRGHPFCMSISESKIEDAMDFLVNKLGFQVSDIAKYPVVLSMSLVKRIIPRGSVVLVLKSKGLVTKLNLGRIFRYDEKYFLDRFIYRHEKEADKLLKLYKAKLSLAG
ncbi:transcription termination factor MTERF9, chloroplastic-like [Abrus precatorius]|uniref:Transcription termination factor MTERF9, chloroplastic-like n=1 Tax=Abrus precatorius TaxID=3816 RepID=A0A8B8JWZ5_ABRPR|nr:transcription termination factor MTERF9, chloroplastic-like [Abrus precatorius]